VDTHGAAAAGQGGRSRPHGRGQPCARQCRPLGASLRGVRWSDLPLRYGAYKSVYKRFSRWAENGVWQRLFETLSRGRDNEYLIIDSSIVRVQGLPAAGEGGRRVRLWRAPEEG